MKVEVAMAFRMQNKMKLPIVGLMVKRMLREYTLIGRFAEELNYTHVT